jgi:AraC-like DNA-binding protein
MTCIMPRHLTETEMMDLHRLFKTGFNQVLSDGDTAVKKDALIYGYADRNYMIYDMAQNVTRFRDLFHQVAHEVIYERFGMLPFIELRKTASLFKNKNTWEIMAQFQCRTFPSVKVEVKNVVVFTRESKLPEGAYTLITIDNYEQVKNRLRSKPAEHELENLDQRITEALEALH